MSNLDLDQESDLGENFLSEDEEDLLFSTSDEPRIFELNSQSKSTIIGVVLEETEDSFLVGIPSRLVQDSETGDYSLIPYLPVPHIRLLKSGISMIIPMFDPYRSAFMKYYQKFPVENKPKRSNSDVDSELNTMHNSQLEEYLTTKASIGELLDGNETYQ